MLFGFYAEITPIVRCARSKYGTRIKTIKIKCRINVINSANNELAIAIFNPLIGKQTNNNITNYSNNRSSHTSTERNEISKKKCRVIYFIVINGQIECVHVFVCLAFELSDFKCTQDAHALDHHIDCIWSEPAQALDISNIIICSISKWNYLIFYRHFVLHHISYHAIKASNVN